MNEASSLASSVMRWIRRSLAFALVIYFCIFMSEAFSVESVYQILGAENLFVVVTAGLMCSLVVLFAGIAWSVLLASMGTGLSWKVASTVIAVTQIAKYVPGNFAQHLTRAAMVVPSRMSAAAFVGSVFFETLATAFAAIVVGGLGFFNGFFSLIEQSDWFEQSHQKLVWLGLGVLIIAAFSVFCIPYLNNRFQLLRGWLLHRINFPNLKAVVIAVVLFCANFFILGAAFYEVFGALTDGELPGYLFLTGAYALSWLAGYLAPGLPAGLGAREGALSAILGSHVSGVDLVAVLLAMRLASIAADVLSFLLGAIVMRATISSD